MVLLYLENMLNQTVLKELSRMGAAQFIRMADAGSYQGTILSFSFGL